MIKGKSKQNIVTIHLAGGLGNQLFQFAFGKSLINRGIDVKFEFGSLPIDLNKDRRPWLEALVLEEIVVRCTSLYRKFINRIFISISIRIRKLILKFNSSKGTNKITKIGTMKVVHHNGYLPELDESLNGNIFGYHQSYLWAKHARSSLVEDYGNIASSYFDKSLKDAPLVVHIRLGDYKNKPEIGVLPNEYYARAIDLAMAGSKHKSIWLFSNDLDSAIDRIPEKFQNMVKILDSQNDTPLVTLMKMRLGHGYVLANSSLSWWGAFLSYSDAPKVIVPKPWFRLDESPRFLQPEHWEEINVGWK
jgi:hypothetical protein